jgi:hypothetical protein
MESEEVAKKAICPKASVIMMKCTPEVRIAIAPVTAAKAAEAAMAMGTTIQASVMRAWSSTTTA